MRAALLLALAACSETATTPDECLSALVTDVHNVVGTLGSGPNAIAVTWSSQLAANEPEVHGKVFYPDGTFGPEIRVDDPALSPMFDLKTRGVVGNATVLWASMGGFSQFIFRAQLSHADGDVDLFDLGVATRQRAIAFGGIL